jgi:hypothetical protein
MYIENVKMCMAPLPSSSSSSGCYRDELPASVVGNSLLLGRYKPGFALVMREKE